MGLDTLLWTGLLNLTKLSIRETNQWAKLNLKEISVLKFHKFSFFASGCRNHTIYVHFQSRVVSVQANMFLYFVKSSKGA